MAKQMNTNNLQCRKPAHLEDARSDVKIVSDYDTSRDAAVLTEETFGQLMRDTNVYVASAVKGYCPQFILDNYNTIKTGVLYKVVDNFGMIEALALNRAAKLKS